MDPKIDELKQKIAKLEREIEKTKKITEKEKEKKKFIPMKTLHKWSAPSRIFITRDKVWFLKIALIALLSILFFAFLQDFIVILVICIVVLITFLLASIPPHTIDHQLSTRGIFSIDTMYKWADLKNFWVAEKTGHKIIYINTKMRFPSRLVMLINRNDERRVVKILGKYLDYEEYNEKQGKVSISTDGLMINPDRYSDLFYIKNKKKKEKVKKK